MKNWSMPHLLASLDPSWLGVGRGQHAQYDRTMWSLNLALSAAGQQAALIESMEGALQLFEKSR